MTELGPSSAVLLRTEFCLTSSTFVVHAFGHSSFGQVFVPVLGTLPPFTYSSTTAFPRTYSRSSGDIVARLLSRASPIVPRLSAPFRQHPSCPIHQSQQPLSPRLYECAPAPFRVSRSRPCVPSSHTCIPPLPRCPGYKSHEELRVNNYTCLFKTRRITTICMHGQAIAF